MELFFPEPAQAGHFSRINATPSDLPLMSTGVATYPIPPQRGQSVGATRPPQLGLVFHQIGRAARKSDLCYEIRTNGGEAVAETPIRAILRELSPCHWLFREPAI
jgi:hypothetical protein